MIDREKTTEDNRQRVVNLIAEIIWQYWQQNGYQIAGEKIPAKEILDKLHFYWAAASVHELPEYEFSESETIQ